MSLRCYKGAALIAHTVFAENSQELFVAPREIPGRGLEKAVGSGNDLLLGLRCSPSEFLRRFLALPVNAVGHHKRAGYPAERILRLLSVLTSPLNRGISKICGYHVAVSEFS